MTPPTVTALYAALHATLKIALAWRVSTLRRRHKVSLGTGDSPELLTAVRTHANAAEFVPLALLLMLIAELCGGGSVPLHVYGGVLLVGRLMHVYGMPRKAPNVWRVGANAITWGGIVVASIWLIWLRTKR
jgi:hypothetical protein